MFNLNGMTALVTGASGGIGSAVARALASQGARLAISGSNAEKLRAFRDELDEHTPQHLQEVDHVAIACNLGDAEQVEKLVPAALESLGKIDILVNNAGITRDSTFHKMSYQQWIDVVNTNLNACFNVTRPVIEGMRARKWGRIVNVLNIGAKAPGANSTPTSVSRAAGLALTKALSQENAPHGILVNAMLVGLIDSDQWVRRHKTAAGEGKTYDEFLAGMAKGRIPLGRMGKAEEFARMACFLCSDAGSFITGVAINVDGGASPVV